MFKWFKVKSAGVANLKNICATLSSESKSQVMDVIMVEIPGNIKYIKSLIEQNILGN